MRDANCCLDYNQGRSPSLKVVNSNSATGQSLKWYTDTSNEIQPFSTTSKCIAKNANDGSVIVENCNTNADNQKLWTIGTYLEWDASCKPLERASGATSGFLIVSESNCNACMAIHTPSLTVQATECISPSADFEVYWKEDKVPLQFAQWCLESDDTVCVEYNGLGALSVINRAANTDPSQTERWYWEQGLSEISPYEPQNHCAARDGRDIVIKVCSQATAADRAWNVVNPNSYTCTNLNTFSYDSNAGALDKQPSKRFIYLVLPALFGMFAFV